MLKTFCRVRTMNIFGGQQIRFRNYSANCRTLKYINKEMGIGAGGSGRIMIKSIRKVSVADVDHQNFVNKSAEAIELINSNLSSELKEKSVDVQTRESLDPSSYPKTLRRNSNFDGTFLQKNERRVLVIYTGGTIGMMKSYGGLAPIPKMFEKVIRTFPQLHDHKYARKRYSGDYQNRALILPEMSNQKHRVFYTIYEYEPLLDSTNMTMDDWIQIGQDIKENYTQFDGFVVLHGTDTMSYTASALSFMLEHLGKPIIITGSQIPLFESRSDGPDNLLSALILAGGYDIPEVTVCFGNHLYRGNRTTKMSSNSFTAFDSPNMQPLVTMGINIEVDEKVIFRPKYIKKFQFHPCLNRNVGILRLFPSITTEAVKIFLQPPILGVVLQSYGSGNIPTNRKDLVHELELASKRGVLMVNCTQCGHGSVSSLYETGQASVSAGVVPGFDMTPEAALTKLSYILGRPDWTIDEKREMLQTNLRGELTKSLPEQLNAITQRKEYDETIINELVVPGVIENVIMTVASSLGMSTRDEISSIRRVFGPSLSCALVAHCSEINYEQTSLETIFGNSEAQISAVNYEGRTPLHFAASLGDVRTLKFLLNQGASVHKRDSRGFSPLRDAIELNRHEIIQILMDCGAHLTLEPTVIGSELNLAAGRGDIARLQSFLLAGADINEPDPCGRTALHIAVEAGLDSTIVWLLQSGASPLAKNLYGQTPLEIAQFLERKVIIGILYSASIS